MNTKIPQGWQCPVCGKVMSPSTQECVNNHAQAEPLVIELTDEQKAEIVRAFKEMQDAPPKLHPARIIWPHQDTYTVSPVYEWMRPPYKITSGSM